MKNIQRSVPTYVEYIDSIRWEVCPRHHNRHTPSRSPGQPWVVNIHSFCFIAPAAATHGEDDHHVGSHNSPLKSLLYKHILVSKKISSRIQTYFAPPNCSANPQAELKTKIVRQKNKMPDDSTWCHRPRAHQGQVMMFISQASLTVIFSWCTK